MIVAPPKRPRSTEENVLPLINIVFLLLIFFMLAGVLAQNPPFELTPPATADTEQSTQLENKVLAMAADGRLAFGGEPIEREALPEALADWPDDKPLQIRADGGLKADALGELFATLRGAGIAEVNLLTQHKDP
ncbi:biopolymer transport protein ExbD/TolR [Salinisphaera shabanensis T35B1]|jgi:biopolymer transport protein ExbD|uniref:ExbD-TolR family protein n=1 Tax=Salinisphaera shabanensis E1L3A TaxID=1033802 RepID=U2FYB4_9GAMM|nr:biopolymer transporter ExbD [Salinisphaera shabanensis]ERJ19143.1 ExbD-TolR family protein [Salinisphaera shabanensis E1L3A]|tara:strand:+ start:130 stop:531 length:402 start_codon:yes stop_codon:yes gene_type:complete